MDVYTEWTVRHEALTFTASLNVFRCGCTVYTEWTVRHEALTLTASLNVFRCGCLHKVDGEE